MGSDDYYEEEVIVGEGVDDEDFDDLMLGEEAEAGGVVLIHLSGKMDVDECCYIQGSGATIYKT